MEILFEIISSHKFYPKGHLSHVFNESGGYIGRSNESDWVLEDRLKEISRKHLLISCDGKHFYLEDLSSNGVMSTLTRELVGRGERHRIQHGDSFQLGQFVIQARILRDPSSYIQSKLDSSISDVNLELDPLVAMKNQDMRTASERLGLYDDTLKAIPKKSQKNQISLPDHNSAGLDVMLNVRGIPEDWDRETEEEDSEDNINLSLVSDPIKPGCQNPNGQKKIMNNNFNPYIDNDIKDNKKSSVSYDSSSLELTDFFKAIGLDILSLSKSERKRIILLVAELLRSSVSGLFQSLKERVNTQKELHLPITTIEIKGNNPLKFSSSSEAAFNNLLKTQKDMLPPDEAVKEGFQDLNTHSLALLEGAKEAFNSALNRLSPKTIEENTEERSFFKGKREVDLWRNYTKLYNEMIKNNSFSDFFQLDFRKGYEAKLTVSKNLKSKAPDGDKK